MMLSATAAASVLPVFGLREGTSQTTGKVRSVHSTIYTPVSGLVWFGLV